MMKLGLYSITYSGTWYKGEFLSIKEMIRKAKALGYEGIEIDLKRPHGFPLDLDEKARTEIREFKEQVLFMILVFMLCTRLRGF